MIKIDPFHPTFLLKPSVQAYVDDFLVTHGFHYFQYLRCFDNGGISLLTNHTRLFEHMSQVKRQPVIFSSFNQDQIGCHSYWFLWDEALPAYPVSLAREFGLFHGATLVRRSKGFYDMIAVALPSEKQNIGSFYLSKYRMIEEFIHRFDIEHHALIHRINQTPLVLPKAYRDVNYKKLCLHRGKYQIQMQDRAIHITTQELRCCRLLSQGHTYKEIGRSLRISPRTVETYIRRLKDRAQLDTALELKSLLSHCT